MPDTTSYSVYGTIYDEYNIPLPDAHVQVYEVDLRIEKLIINVNTDGKGLYSLNFLANQAAPEFKAPDIYIAIRKKGETKIAGKSSVYFNIKPETVINYRIGNATILPINEFDRLVNLFRPLLAASRIDFDKLEESNDNKDISFLSGETGVSFDTIKALVDAHRMCKSTSLPAEIWFGLFKNNIAFPSDVNLFMEDVFTNAINLKVSDAIEKNLISSKFSEQIHDTVNQLKRFYEGNLRQKRGWR